MTSSRTRSPEYISFLPLFSFIAASWGSRGSAGSLRVRDKEMKSRKGQGFMSGPENSAFSKHKANTASKGE